MLQIMQIWGNASDYADLGFKPHDLCCTPALPKVQQVTTLGYGLGFGRGITTLLAYSVAC
jgi:hypothetical protein